MRAELIDPLLIAAYSDTNLRTNVKLQLKVKPSTREKFLLLHSIVKTSATRCEKRVDFASFEFQRKKWLANN